MGDWISTTSLPDCIQSHITVTWNGRIYVIGGWTGYRWLSTVYYADINPDGSLSSWSSTSSLPQPRGHEQAGILHNGVIYEMGGQYYPAGTGPFALHDTVYYAEIDDDGTVEGWSATTPLPYEMGGHSVSVVGDRLYVIGGYYVEPTVYLDEVRSAQINDDGSLGSWSEEPSLPETRFHHSSLSYDGRIYVFGGRNELGENVDTIYYRELPHKWAVIIGVDEYNPPQSSQEGPTKSARDIYQALVDAFNFPVDNVHLLTDEIENNEDNVTREILFEELDWLKEVAGEEDTILFYYAGHGEGSRFWPNYDPQYDPEWLATHEWLNGDDEIAAKLNEINCETLIVILDISYAGGFIRDDNDGDDVVEDDEWSDLALGSSGDEADGRIVLVACGEVISRNDDTRNWPWIFPDEMAFTHFLIEGFGNDEDGDGKISIEEAFRYASNQFPRNEPLPPPYTVVRYYQDPQIYDGFPAFADNGAEHILGDVLPESEPWWLKIFGLSPINLLVTDPEGRRIGYDPSTGSAINEIPGATYSGPATEPQAILIPDYTEGEYLIEVYAYGTGDYTITMETTDPNEEIVAEYEWSGTAIAGEDYGSSRGLSTGGLILLPATIDMHPDTLNLKGKGKWVTCYIELPGIDLDDIVVSTISLNDEIPVEPNPVEIGDYDGDSIPDLMIKFDREALVEYSKTVGVGDGDMIDLVAVGQLTDGTLFVGADTVKTILQPKG